MPAKHLNINLNPNLASFAILFKGHYERSEAITQDRHGLWPRDDATPSLQTQWQLKVQRPKAGRIGRVKAIKVSAWVVRVF
ncbi:hypothetical protein [Thiomicrospira sp. ALE5]|uniref:hypothetical protein n=1 Tax=Thiomicrospira sp. ALE5 TaxID=748650 RepID=UPI000B8678D3|nr:hypothetical protein [Thiomicrospira sp. ALE5]